MSTNAPLIPAHVPPELVLPYPLASRTTTFENPYETLIPRIHDGPPVFYAPDAFPGGNLPAWVVRRTDDLRKIYFDTEHFSKKGLTRFAEMIGEDWDVIPTELDPPRHTGFRAALNPIFSPRSMAALDSKVHQRAHELIDRFRVRGECDFVEEFAVPFPVTIFLDLLGLPHAKMKQFLKWEHTLLHNPDMGERIRGTLAVKAFLTDMIGDRQKNPGDDLISNALQLEVDGRKWTPTEVFGHCFNLYLGGLDTVASNMGLHFHHLATHPADQALLRAKPEMIPAAVEELLRAYAAVTTARICVKQIEIGGVTIMPGDYVMMATPLASRDPEEFEKPDQVCFDRPAKHLTFGYGVHRCLGAALARRELQIAIKEMLTALPPFSLKPDAAVPFFVGGVIHVQALPLTWQVNGLH